MSRVTRCRRTGGDIGAGWSPGHHPGDQSCWPHSPTLASEVNNLTGDNGERFGRVFYFWQWHECCSACGAWLWSELCVCRGRDTGVRGRGGGQGGGARPGRLGGVGGPVRDRDHGGGITGHLARSYLNKNKVNQKSIEQMLQSNSPDFKWSFTWMLKIKWACSLTFTLKRRL